MVKDWKGRTAVYTAVITDFEHPGPHVFEDGVDYLYLCDGTSRPVQHNWRIHLINHMSHVNPRRLSKLPKHHPHFFDFLRKYDYLVWIDGDMQIKHPHFVEEIMSYLDNGIVFSPHFDPRHCAYTEAEIRPAKYQQEPMDPQVNYYRERGFPKDFGLYETGVYARDMHHPQATELGLRWYIQNMVFSYQDQVSLPYVMWDMGYQPAVLPKSFRDYDWVHINAHRSES